MLLALAFLSACSKKEDAGENPRREDPAQEQGTPTPVGALDGTPKSQTVIGAAGGYFISADAELRVTFPPGALTGDQTVSIERIVNHNPLGIGHGYRLKPEGITFAKPVSLTFNYFRNDTIAYPVEAMRVAYQNSKGVWMAVPGAEINTDRRTVTVQTTHFSDWSQFTPVRLDVKQPVVGVGSSTPVTLILDDDFLAPLNREKPMKAGLPLNDKFIKGWNLNGPGRILGNGATVRYVAPPAITTPPESRATVSVEVFRELGKPATMKVNAVIKTMEGFVRISIDGGDEFTMQANPIAKVGDHFQLSSNTPGYSTGMVLSWPFGVGTHGYSIEPKPDKAVVSLFYNDANYGHTYLAGNEATASPGAVTITSMGVIDGLVTGTFVVEKAGKYPLLKNTIHFKGYFQTTRIAD